MVYGISPFFFAGSLLAVAYLAMLKLMWTMQEEVSYMPTTAPAATLLLTGISDMAGFWSRKKRKKI